MADGMDRPIYESASDIARERGVAAALEASWHCKADKLPKMYPADLILYGKGNKARAWVEVKTRKYAMGTFPTYHLSAMKVAHLASLEAVTGVPSLLVVQLTDALLVHRIDPPYEIEAGGRRDRGDWQDVEPVCAIPFTEFTIIETRQEDAA